ncbi:MAG: tetratricopeptide repeat protein [Firmicutes bacterium]|nr:tetratricopeptide repeat protein [Bacillota bacterium]
MALVAAKCTECAAKIEIDDCKKTGTCRFCGTTFVTQKVVNITKDNEKDKVHKNLTRGETFIKLKDWERAIDAFEDAAELDPDNYKCWLGLVRSYTESFTDLDDTEHLEYYNNALAVANDDEKLLIENLCNEFIKLSEAHRKGQQEKTISMVNEKLLQKKKSKKLMILMIALCLIFGAGGMVTLFLSILLDWRITVPLGVILMIFAIPPFVLMNKFERKCIALNNEIQNIQQPNSLNSFSMQGFFNNFFDN